MLEPHSVDKKEERKKEAADRAIKNLSDSNMLSCLSHKKGGVEGNRVFPID